jgi:hypothetical protein
MSKKGKKHGSGGKRPKTWSERFDRLLQSQVLLGALVAVLTVSNAYVIYRSSKASLAGSSLDFYASREMHYATITHLDGNARYLTDLAAYNEYRLLREEDPDLAENALQHASEELLAGMVRPGGPFDEAYILAIFGEASTAMDEAQARYDEADEASLRSERFSLASTILAVGLGATAWAGLLHERNALRLVFSVTAVVSLVAGLIMAFYFPGS